MSTAFSVIADDFGIGLTSLRQLVEVGQSQSALAKTRITSVHAATLLLAATFEEFIREMAKEFAVQVVSKANDVSDLPDTLLETAWKRTFDQLARTKSNSHSKKLALQISAKKARPEIDALCSFVEGDITQDIFSYLIHNENNMRAGEINKLFKVGGLSNICVEICNQTSLKSFFAVDDADKAHGELLFALEKFFNRRNEIAHSLNSASSTAPDEIFRDIDLFQALSDDLGATLETKIANL